jgi:hypothetical protein
MTLTDDALEHFRGAWLAAQGDDFASRMERKSLAALALENEALERALFELTSRAQSELDLHLAGISVHGHEANAESFADFVRGVADATKEVAKNLMGSQKRGSTLRILAPSPGSVRVVLRAAPPIEMHGPTPRETWVPSVDSTSLDRVATLLARSEVSDGDTDDVLSALTASLPARAHPGLRRAAKAIKSQDWTVTGQLRSQRGFEPVSLGVGGATALLRALGERQEDEDEVTLDGTIDGQRRSIGALWFAPDGGAPIEAAVPTPELIEQVVQYDAAQHRVRAIFYVVTIVGRGTNAKVRRVHTLKSINPIGTPRTLI